MNLDLYFTVLVFQLLDDLEFDLGFEFGEIGQENSSDVFLKAFLVER